ncbi:hypothetical protein AAFF_G00169160 [Aldrovandia affinis]|uniref:Dedicator of cytokinesis TPR repeats region domain-containing protein n=1 Tax=Aldrovandia affinis TaxID=143900 RepID=A0AAD7VXG6_9TELE|nr:hypothetical protein AAFF_G00169160 [Aldrovandia affinis]
MSVEAQPPPQSNKVGIFIKVLKWHVDRIADAEHQDHIQQVLRQQSTSLNTSSSPSPLLLATGGQNEEEFRCCVHELFMSIRFFLSQGEQSDQPCHPDPGKARLIRLQNPIQSPGSGLRREIPSVTPPSRTAIIYGRANSGWQCTRLLIRKMRGLFPKTALPIVMSLPAVFHRASS